MIELDLASIGEGGVPVKSLRSDSSRKFCQELCSFSSSNYIQIQRGHVKITGMFGLGDRVPDVDRYRVFFNNGMYDVRPHQTCQIASQTNRFCDLPTDRTGFNGTVLLLLESPHKDEYKNGTPIAPARGQTGIKIERHLACILNNPHNNCMTRNIGDNFRIIIANPVQFQTSLWTIHKGALSDWRKLRNAIWKTLWNVPWVQRNFCCRLRHYNPDLVLNCCTHKLNDLASSFLLQCGFGARTYRAAHPSVWKCSTKFHPI